MMKVIIEIKELKEKMKQTKIVKLIIQKYGIIYLK